MRKTFGDTVAINVIDLTVPRSSFFGLVGPNGAGKTTAVRAKKCILMIFGHSTG